jgi:hypothetical protein
MINSTHDKITNFISQKLTLISFRRTNGLVLLTIAMTSFAKPNNFTFITTHKRTTKGITRFALTHKKATVKFVNKTRVLLLRCVS